MKPIKILRSLEVYERDRPALINLVSADAHNIVQTVDDPRSAYRNHLTRYWAAGPISDHSNVAARGDKVTFTSREDKRVGNERQPGAITLAVRDFVRRWCLHI